MYLGAVPISVDCIAGPAEQLDYGSCGVLVPPDDPVQFADAMYRIATDDLLWARLREAGIQHAAKFALPRFLEAWTSMLLEVSDEARARRGVAAPRPTTLPAQ